MAKLALELPIFIASPNRAVDQRNAVEHAIQAKASQVAKHQILLKSVRWERDARPTAEPPQQFINRLLEGCELVVVVFNREAGSGGAWEEFYAASELVRQGRADDVFLYYLQDPETGKPVAAIEHELDRLEQVGRPFAFPYNDGAHLEEQFNRHLQNWLNTWEKVPQIAAWTLSQVAPERLPGTLNGEGRWNVFRPLLAQLDLGLVSRLGAVAIAIYQSTGPEGVRRDLPFDVLPEGTALAIPEANPTHAQLRKLGLMGVSSCPLVRRSESVVWADEEWFHLFCAIGLRTAIASGEYRAVESVPYINPIHQFLRVLAREEHRSEIVGVLRGWLRGSPNAVATRPIVRNFAAYVLGMMDASEAQDDLAAAVKYDHGENVALYSITSLAKLRARRFLPLLVEKYASTTDARMRLTLGQAICRIVGIAEYEL